MASNDYHFVETWKLNATVEELAVIFKDATSLTQWWSNCFLAVETYNAGTESVGQQGRVHVRGFLPYTLQFEFTITAFNYPEQIQVAVQGDFEGRYIFMVEENDGDVTLTFDTRLHVTKPIIRYLSWMLKPLFKANHRWCMERGLVQIEQELARRRSTRRPKPATRILPLPQRSPAPAFKVAA